MKLTTEQMRSLPEFFREIKDPRRAQGKRHRIHVVLAIAAGAILCGMRGYKKQYQIGARRYCPECVNYSVVDSKKENTSYRVRAPFVMSSSGLNRLNKTRRSSNGMQNTEQ